MTIPEFWPTGWTAAVVNHLLQSTAVALLAWLCTLALRSNHARVRYAVWLFASAKFLVPFSLLIDLGAHFAKPLVTRSTTASYLFVEQIRERVANFPAVPPNASPQASDPAHLLPQRISPVQAGCDGKQASG